MEVKKYNPFVKKPPSKSKPKIKLRLRLKLPKAKTKPKPKTKLEAGGLSLENKKNLDIIYAKALVKILTRVMTRVVSITLTVTFSMGPRPCFTITLTKT